MRTLLIAITILAFTACSDKAVAGPEASGLAGTYTLVSAEGQSVPGTFTERDNQLDLVSGSITLSVNPEMGGEAPAGEYTIRLRWGTTFEPMETHVSSGQWFDSESPAGCYMFTSPSTLIFCELEPGRMEIDVWVFGKILVHELLFQR